jgi:hypothetical protein
MRRIIRAAEILGLDGGWRLMNSFYFIAILQFSSD